MILLALALLAQTAAVSTDCPSICDAGRLKPYFDKLARVRRDRTTVRILQIGDSHTAGDQITGAWRAALQARYGNGGRGMLAPGRPYQGYLTRDVTAAQGSGWTVSGIFGAAWRGTGAPPIGISGYSLTAPGVAGERLSIAADRGGFDRYTVCALTGPGAGTLTLDLGNDTAVMPLDAPRPGARCQTVEATGFAATAGLTASGAVTVVSWATERVGGGVVLSNLGTVGAQLIHAARADDRVIATELASYRPDLLVVAFGTNEAFSPRFSAAEYSVRLRAGIARLKRLAPGVPVLLIGAPDSATRQAALQVGEDGVSPPCVTAGTAGWRPTAALVTVQAIQRQIAREEGLAFWDWSRAMGGACTALAWATATPPLMRLDRVHFTSAGGAAVARLLQADLDRAATEVADR